jgi:aminoglycoside N3'-acetyltransferase
MTASGPRAAELMEGNARSTPFALDEHSAMWKLTMMGGKVALLGRGFYGNVPLHLIEYAHADEYPRAVFVNKPVKMTYMDYQRRMQCLDVMLHAPGWYVTAASGVKFCEYLDRRYSLYKRRKFTDVVGVVGFDAKAQYEATYQEMKSGVCWYDPQFDG